MSTTPPTALPGTFPLTGSSPPMNLSSSGFRPSSSASFSSSTSTSSANSSRRGRIRKSSIQTRRPVVSLGLGVSFAPLPAGGTTSPITPTPAVSSAPSQKDPPRRSSFSSPVLSVDTALPVYSPTPTMSRHSSRRSSLTHLASFLSGIEHHTRVRSPGVHGGRGVSRSASRSTSRAGDRRPHDDPRSRATSRASSRRSSLAVSHDGLWNVQEQWNTNTDGRTSANMSTTVSKTKVRSPVPDEEPFLDTAPSSPLPRHLHYSSRSSDGNGGADASLEAVEVFEVGERIGVGVWLEGRGGWTRDCFDDTPGKALDALPGNGPGGPPELEVVRRLGEGTYAIVYLVREVLCDAKDSEDLTLSPTDPLFDDFSTATPSRPPIRSWGSEPFLPLSEPTYGRNFALKCLCKKDLSEDLVAVQRGEAILHRSLPEHEFIVRLYGAYETDDWLFLVLEYCPGQDLYYWLDERADDSDVLYDHHSSATSPYQSPATTNGRNSFDVDRPTVTNGARAEIDEAELSRTITAHDMLANASNASEFDSTPPSPSLLTATANTSLLSRKRLRLISRMFGQMCSAVQACHDVGISHRDIKPENFIVMDCRSGELGASESASAGKVVVKITDWGLGTRETQCEDFDCGSKPYMAYECRNNLHPTYDPRQADVWSLGLVLLNLLFHRNPWNDPTLDDPDFAAYVENPREFLKDRFEGIGEEVATFLSEQVFCDVLEKDERGELKRRVSAGEFGKWASKLVTMMGEGKQHCATVSDQTLHLFYSVSRPGTSYIAPAYTSGPSLLSQLAPQASIAPPATPNAEGLSVDVKDASSQLPRVAEAEEERNSPSSLGISSHSATAAVDSLANNHQLPEDKNVLHSSSLLQTDYVDPPPSFDVNPLVTDGKTVGGSDDHEVDGESPNLKSKRRKRGARKGRSGRLPGEASSSTHISVYPSSTSPNATVDDHTLYKLATASQDLTRELSKVKQRSSGAQPTIDVRSSSTQPHSTHLNVVDKSDARFGGVFGRMRGLVMDGNPELNAFRQRALERDASHGGRADTLSAPAKMQGRSLDVTSSRGSFGASSVGSWSTHDGDDHRGRSGADHWSSASSRRERQQQRRKKADFSPSASMVAGTTSSSGAESSSQTPLSSFSSIASSDVCLGPPSAGATVRDWRQPAPRQYSMSRPPPSSRSSADRRGSAERSKHIGPAAKPKLRDASIDTADLGVELPHVVAMHSTPQAPSIDIVPSVPVLAPKTNRPSSTTSHTSSATVEPPPIKTNKLAKMLNSISVFNRSQDHSR